MKTLSSLSAEERASLVRADAWLFDFDGTLLDSARDLLGTLRQMMTEDGLPLHNGDELLPLASLGGRALMKQAYGACGIRISADDLNKVFYPRFLATYEHHMTCHSRLFPDTLALLDCLRELGKPLFLATNKPEKPTRLLLDHFHLTTYFSVISGGDTYSCRKPDPNFLFKCLNEYKGERRRFPVMVGDASPDIDAARAAGFPSLLVSFGYSPQPLASLSADYLVSSFAELIDLLTLESSSHG